MHLDYLLIITKQISKFLVDMPFAFFIFLYKGPIRHVTDQTMRMLL